MTTLTKYLKKIATNSSKDLNTVGTLFSLQPAIWSYDFHFVQPGKICWNTGNSTKLSILLKLLETCWINED